MDEFNALENIKLELDEIETSHAYALQIVGLAVEECATQNISVEELVNFWRARNLEAVEFNLEEATQSIEWE